MTTCFLISVYINDNYNDFVKAINSCLNQTIPPTKIIRVKDGPIKKKILNYCSKISTKQNVLLVDCVENVGLGSALNKGFDFVEEDIVIRMDSDDISRSNRVEKIIEFFKKNPETGIVGSYISEFINEIGDKNMIRKVPVDSASILEKLKFSCPFNHVSVAFNYKFLPKNPYRINFDRLEDYPTWYYLLVPKKIRSANISEVLVDVKLGNDFLKRRIGFKLFNSWLKAYNIMRKDGYISSIIFYRNAVIRFIQFNLLPKKFLSILYTLSRSTK